MKKIKNLSLTKKLSAVLMALLMVSAVPLSVYADTYDEQIRVLQAEVDTFQGEASRLAAEADTLANKIAVINSQKRAIQTQIDLSQAKYDQLVAQIKGTEDKIAKQKDLLGGVLAKLYVESKTTTIEMLASSESIGDYMDKQTYQSSIRNKLNSSIKQIKQLKEQLDTQKKQTEAVLADQKAQREQLASQEAEQARLLAETQGQEAAYQGLVASRNANINKLREEQRRANARFTQYAPGTGPACGGGYPGKWCNIPMDTVVDDWGMYNRECVSYTAYRVAASGRYMPYWGGIGNANQWDDNARAMGLEVDSSPSPGDIAVSNAGYYGHVMYVEAVNSDGSIYVSQYNAGWDGRYSTATISTSGLVFITF